LLLFPRRQSWQSSRIKRKLWVEAAWLYMAPMIHGERVTDLVIKSSDIGCCGSGGRTKVRTAKAMRTRVRAMRMYVPMATCLCQFVSFATPPILAMSRIKTSLHVRRAQSKGVMLLLASKYECCLLKPFPTLVRPFPACGQPKQVMRRLLPPRLETLG
jgi:hypothetical protein